MSDLEGNSTAVVIDNGSWTTAAGFCGDDAPRVVIPTVVERETETMVVKQPENAKTVTSKITRRLKYPIEHGIVTNWDDMETIWHDIFRDHLDVDPADHPVLLTEAPMNPRMNRERTTEIMFERFNVPAMYLAVQSVMSLISTGRSSGVVVDIGDSVLYTVPVYDGHYLPYATYHLPIGGRDVTECLMASLVERGYKFTTTADRKHARDIKETHCYAALDFDQEMEKASSTPSSLAKTYRLPDCQPITVGSERFRAPEGFFKPSVFGQELQGIQRVTYNSIMKCNSDLREDLFCNVVLSGGSAMLPGIVDRMQKELCTVTPGSTRIEVVAPPDGGKLSAWIGGSILASRSEFEKMWISKEEYDEYGPTMVHRKCF